MNNKTLFALWGVMLAICAGLGFIPEPEGAVRWMLTALAVLCFLPPLLLVRRATAADDRKTLALIRNLALSSLVMTVVLLIANFLSVTASQTVGDILYYILIIVTSPMVCSQYWALSLFLWAYLMIACAAALKKK